MFVGILIAAQIQLVYMNSPCTCTLHNAWSSWYLKYMYMSNMTS